MDRGFLILKEYAKHCVVDAGGLAFKFIFLFLLKMKLLKDLTHYADRDRWCSGCYKRPRTSIGYSSVGCWLGEVN